MNQNLANLKKQFFNEPPDIGNRTLTASATVTRIRDIRDALTQEDIGTAIFVVVVTREHKLMLYTAIDEIQTRDLCGLLSCSIQTTRQGRTGLATMNQESAVQAVPSIVVDNLKAIGTVTRMETLIQEDIVTPIFVGVVTRDYKLMFYTAIDEKETSDLFGLLSCSIQTTADTTCCRQGGRWVPCPTGVC